MGKTCVNFKHDYRLQSAREIKRKENEKAAKNKTGIKSHSIRQFLKTSRIYTGQDADKYCSGKSIYWRREPQGTGTRHYLVGEDVGVGALEIKGSGGVWETGGEKDGTLEFLKGWKQEK